jgi:hypothetical protein
MEFSSFVFFFNSFQFKFFLSCAGHGFSGEVRLTPEYRGIADGQVAKGALVAGVLNFAHSFYKHQGASDVAGR